MGLSVFAAIPADERGRIERKTKFRSLFQTKTEELCKQLKITYIIYLNAYCFDNERDFLVDIKEAGLELRFT